AAGRSARTMRGTLNFMSSSGRSEQLAVHPGLPVPVEIRAVRGARRLRLRLDERRGVLKLTCPMRTSRRAALAWAAEQREWVDTQLADMLPAEPFAAGERIPVEGLETRLVWTAGEARVPRLDSGELRCGGLESGFERRIETFLKRLALETLSSETAEAAAAAGVAPRSVSVGDANTRWGSCSSERRIRYSWRLILAPPAARRYVVAHEVAHLVHLDHGPGFKALERRLFAGFASGEVAAARSLLRRVGPRLKRIGRGR
ncbi:MAG TPA: YgjP-like metallopeptidase domain-containing protein, partial [Sphingomicrobium sp.]|nr:YgjP-like metallopeptidase domain-containing protein [Sphingomicrobium sp.]